MTDDRRLQESLHRLRTEIDALGVGDDEARRRLRGLVEEIERTLQTPGRTDGGLVAQLKTSVLRFEASHPRIAGVMNEVVEQLGNMGI
jgi:hypothetical protein